MTGTADAVAEIAGSRLEGLRYVLPGAYGTAFVVLAVDAMRLSPFDESHFRTESLAVGLLVAFILGYMFHLVAIRLTGRKTVKAMEQAFADLEEEYERAFDDAPAPRKIPRGPHDVVNVLQSDSRLQWRGVRPLVLAKFNKLSGQKLTQRDLDANEQLRWFLYHFCYSYILKSGAAAEAVSSRSQFDMVRAFGVALWFGFGGAILSLLAMAVHALAFGPIQIFWQTPLRLVFIAVGLVAPFMLGGLLQEQQDRASKRLAGAVYEAFLAT